MPAKGEFYVVNLGGNDRGGEPAVVRVLSGVRGMPGYVRVTRIVSSQGDQMRTPYTLRASSLQPAHRIHADDMADAYRLFCAGVGR